VTAPVTGELIVVRVAVCVVTFRRPRWLAECLQSLEALTREPGMDLSVVVIDNDPGGAARAQVDAARLGFPWRLLYEIEPTRGISFARNRAVRVALEQGVNFVAFMDDDEAASPDWLAHLLRAQRTSGAEVVSGPVEPVYEPDVPKWIVRGKFFARPRYPDGTRLGTAITANCLIDARRLRGDAEPFHPAFALIGGGDTHFFTRLHRDGASIVWAEQALVRERIPGSRATVGWLLRRAYRGGASFAHCERLLHHSRGWMLLRLITGAGRSLAGLLLAVPSLLLGKAHTVRALQTMFVGLGLLAGTCGFAYREYAVVHGR
jgi:glycosyltransferase involved in cell wall biosynthesis